MQTLPNYYSSWQRFLHLGKILTAVASCSKRCFWPLLHLSVPLNCLLWTVYCLAMHLTSFAHHSAVYCLRFIVHFLLVTVFFELSIVFCLLYSLYCLLFTANFLLFTFYSLLSTTPFQQFPLPMLLTKDKCCSWYFWRPTQNAITFSCKKASPSSYNKVACYCSWCIPSTYFFTKVGQTYKYTDKCSSNMNIKAYYVFHI